MTVETTRLGATYKLAFCFSLLTLKNQPGQAHRRHGGRVGTQSPPGKCTTQTPAFPNSSRTTASVRCSAPELTRCHALAAVARASRRVASRNNSPTVAPSAAASGTCTAAPSATSSCAITRKFPIPGPNTSGRPSTADSTGVADATGTTCATGPDKAGTSADTTGPGNVTGTARAAGTATAPDRQATGVAAVSTGAAGTARIFRTGTTVTAPAEEQSTFTAVAAGTGTEPDHPGAAGAAIAEPTGRTAIAAVEATTAIAQQPAGATDASQTVIAGICGPGVAVADQDAAVGMLSRSVADQQQEPEPDLKRRCHWHARPDLSVVLERQIHPRRDWSHTLCNRC